MIEPTSFPSVSNMKSIAGNSEIPPVWLTGRLSLAGNSPKFNFSSASSSTQSSSSARSPESSRSAQTETESRPSMVSNFPKPPPDSSPRNAGQCGRSNSVLLLYFLRIQNIQGIFPNIANNSKYSLVPKFQSPTRQLPSIFSQFSPAMAEGKFSTLVHLLKFIETFAVNYDWTEAFMMCEWKYCIFVRIYILWKNFYGIVLTMTMPKI